MSHRSDDESDEDSYGPQLPPNFQPSTSTTLGVSKEVIGPLLPPGFKERNSSSSSNEGGDTSYDVRAVSFNPSGRNDQVPDEFSKEEEVDDDEDVIGPVLPSSGEEIDRKRGYLDPSYVQSIVSKCGAGEQESKDMRREEWMTVVPKNVVKKMGFKSVTSFCKKPVCNDVDDDDQDEDVSAERQGSITDPSSSTSKMSIEKEEKVRLAYEDYTKNKRSLLDQHRESMSKVCICLILCYFLSPSQFKTI